MGIASIESHAMRVSNVLPVRINARVDDGVDAGFAHHKISGVHDLRAEAKDRYSICTVGILSAR